MTTVHVSKEKMAIMVEQHENMMGYIEGRLEVLNTILAGAIERDNIGVISYPYVEENTFSVEEGLAGLSWVTNTPHLFYGHDIRQPLVGMKRVGFKEHEDVSESDAKVILDNLEADKPIYLFVVVNDYNWVTAYRLAKLSSDKTQVIPTTRAVSGDVMLEKALSGRL